MFAKESADIAFSQSKKSKPRVDIREEHVIQAAHKLEQAIGLPPLTLKKLRLFEKQYKIWIFTNKLFIISTTTSRKRKRRKQWSMIGYICSDYPGIFDS